MKSERRNTLIFRWSIVTAGLITLFWTSWYLMNGSVPIVTSITVTSDWTLDLPFGISRWWDVLIGPIWSTGLILLVTNKRVQKNEELVAGLVFGLVFGLSFGLVSGLVAGLIWLIRLLANWGFWARIGDWLMAKN